MFLFIKPKKTLTTTEDIVFALLKAIVSKYKKIGCSYDYIVLTTRRCFCILSALLKSDNLTFRNRCWLIKNKSLLSEIYEKVISSQKINIVGEQFKDKNVLLVDDIMIHGQTVYSIYKQIINFSVANIDTLVLIRNIEFPDYYYFKTQKPYDYLFRKIDCNWREISNDFVSYMHNSDQMYISYVYGYQVEKPELSGMLKDKAVEKIMCDFSKFIKHDTYKKSKQPIYYKVKDLEKYKCLKYSFLRCYPNCKKEDLFTVIPYAELSDMKTSCIENIWGNVWKAGKVPKELKNIVDSTDKYKALTVIASFAIYKLLFGTAKLNETKEIDKSYVDNFVSVLNNQLCENVMDVIENLYITETHVNTSSNSANDDTIPAKLSILASEFTNAENTDVLLKLIEQFFYDVSDEEEDLFKQAISDGINQDGVLTQVNIPDHTRLFKTSQLYEAFPNDQKDTLCAFLIYLLDNGVSSHVVSSKNGYVSTSIKAGEQSYHLFSDLTGSAFRPIYLYLKKTKKLDVDIKYEMNQKLTDKLVKSQITTKENIDSIVHVITNPPGSLSANYFGIVNQHINRYTTVEEKEEAQFMEIVEDVLKN